MAKTKKPPPDAPKNKGGRPLKYRAEYARQAESLCLLGYTDEKLAAFFGVAEATINRWKYDHPGFREAVHGGKDAADAKVVSALMQRALGYSHPEVDIKVVNGEIVQTKVVKHYPPDTPAAMFWLINRQKGQWKAKHDEEGNPTDAAPVTKIEIEVLAPRSREA